jgi:hypothetical protein
MLLIIPGAFKDINRVNPNFIVPSLSHFSQFSIVTQ